MTRKCKICSSVFRDEVDSYIAKNTYTFNDLEKIFQDKGFLISSSTIRRHATLHTNFEFKTNEVKTIAVDDLANNDGLDMSIDLDSYLALFGLSQNDFKVNSIDDFFKLSKNFYGMNTMLIMKLYAVVNLQVDLNIKGTGNFPLDKVKCLNLLMTLNHNLHTQIREYDTTKNERVNTALFLKGLFNEIDIAVKKNDISLLNDYTETIRQFTDKLISENEVLYEDYVSSMHKTSKSEKIIENNLEYYKGTQEDLKNLED